MPKTLLLADDSVTIQKVVGITFANEDVELVTVDNGDEALVRARQIKPDLVLADIGMPGLDGYALCAAIRRDPELANTPVLLLTGTFETYDEERARQVGANGHISKPFEAQTLVDRVLAMLAQGAAPAASQPSPATRPIPAPGAHASPAAHSAPESAVRARIELPPLPGANFEKAARTLKPRSISPFDFDTSPEPSPAEAATPAPLWEAEPDFEASDDAPARRALGDFGSHEAADAGEPTAPDATRLFTPDLLGRPSRAPQVEEPPQSASPAGADFSFGDLDFEEPTGPQGSQTQIFGESSAPSGAETVFATRAKQSSADETDEDSPADDRLYGSTRFLDPRVSTSRAPGLDAPMPAAPQPAPDLHGSDEVTAPSHTLAELELEDAEPEIEAERLDDADPFAEPFSANTSAALDEPQFAPMRAPRVDPAPARAAVASFPQRAAQLANDEEFEGDLLDVEPIPESPMPEPPTELVAWGEIHESHEPDPRPTAPLPALSRPKELGRSAAPMIDSALLSQTLEKVAWEAFGSLSEQVVNEVRKRVEAVVWEVVPQMCERLIREEIARLKAELPE